MIQAISSGLFLIASFIWFKEIFSLAMTSSILFASSGKFILGVETLGQSNLGKYFTFLGSGESVRESV